MKSLEHSVFTLTKGANVGLDDLDAELGSLTVILETGDIDDQPVDADVSVLLVIGDGRVRSNDDLIFYNQPVALDGAVHLREKIRTERDGRAVSADLLTLDLDEVPEDVHRIVLGASLDPALSTSFGQVGRPRLVVQRTSDAEPLVEYPITDAGGELALLFGEFYRRDDRWRLRAIGQGYARGLAALVQDFGIEVDTAGVDTAGVDTAEVDTAEVDTAGVDTAEAAEEVVGFAEPSITEPAPDDAPPAPAPVVSTSRRVRVRRTARAPRMPADWNATVPAGDGTDLKPARLFPVAGIGSGEEQERRASSALLAVMPLVRDFGRSLLVGTGAPAGAMRTYVEVPFGHGDQAYRPDGLITVRRGSREWTALVEVKTATARLDRSQIETYLDITRAKGFDAVITISNEVMAASDDHPLLGDRRKLRKVALHHLSWDEIRAKAILLTRHHQITDATQRVVLEEFVRYMQHDRSGLHGFTTMGKEWVAVRDGVKNKTLRPRDAGTGRVSSAFDQLVAHVALHLTELLGVPVTPAVPRRASDATSRCQQLADSGQLFGILRIPGAVNPVILTADLRADRVTCAIDVDAPRQGRALTRVSWLLRQLKDARGAVRIEAGTGGREPTTARLLGGLRERPQSLVPTDDRDIRSFRVALDVPMGLKRGVGRGSLIGSVIEVTDTFYAEVVQHLRPWVARPTGDDSPIDAVPSSSTD